MEVPTEMQFDQAISELQMSSELNHKHGNNQEGECDTCHFCHEIDRRGREANNPTVIDKLMFTVIQDNQTLIASIADPSVMEDLLMLVRMGFLVGYKIQLSENTVSELERMVSLESSEGL
jgi:hypothetical protein